MTDAANRFVLDGYEKAFAAGGGAKQRFRVEHAQVLALSDVPRFKALDVIPSMQPTHCTSDMYWAEARVGPQRAQGAYLWKTFLDQGVPIAGGSDAPVEKIDVLPGIYAAVTRRTIDGGNPDGWVPEEKISLDQTLRAYTAGNAYAVFAEQQWGTLAPGYLADLVVLDRDLFALPAESLGTARVRFTVVGGKVVYRRE